MAPSRVSDSRRADQGGRTQSFALISTLALLAVAFILVIIFATVMRQDRFATASYSQSLKAEQLGLGGLRLVVGELQSEMRKDQVPDSTYPTRLLYLNVSPANIEPQPVGANSAMPDLVKISTDIPAFTGSLFSGKLVGSTVSSTTPSYNGRSVSTTRWNQACLGTFPNNASAPYWIMMTRGGPTNFATGTTFGPTVANSVNNSTPGNSTYVLGRIAYAVYNEGGLLDVTVAGYPSSLSAAQIQAVKGTLAGADLSAVGIANPDALVTWRNAAAAASATTYTNYVSSFIPTNSAGTVYPGDTTFLSRQDLIKAAENGTAGLTPAMLPNLTTFTRERNAPSWGPQQTGNPPGSTIDYATAALTTSAAATNYFIPLIRYTAPQTITGYKADGTSYTYNVVPGDPLVYRRFPLARLAWVTCEGPSADLPATDPFYNPAGTDAAIHACFGLTWSPETSDPNTNVTPFHRWIYVGGSASTEQSSIETLPTVLTENREPNFFELLQAGILSGSLGTSGGPPIPTTYSDIYQASVPLNVFRIGASIITQYSSGSCPIIIEYVQSGTAWQASGIANLPYLNSQMCLAGGDSASSLECYLLFGLWNPTQGTPASPRPAVRMRIAGSMALLNGFGLYLPATWQGGYPANVFAINATTPLSQASNAGVNGFADPHIMNPADIAPSPPLPALPTGLAGSAGMTWAVLPPIHQTPPAAAVTYAGYRVPDFVIDPARQCPDPPDARFSFIVSYYDMGAPFNCWLEYQSSTGEWIPYDYWNGIDDPATWGNLGSSEGLPSLWSEYILLNPATSPSTIQNTALLQPIDPPPTAGYLYYYKYAYEMCDPRSLRFTPADNEGEGNSYTTWFNIMNTSVTTDPNFPSGGRTYPFGVQDNLKTPWYPFGTTRNNSSPAGVTPAAYVDRDGVQRMADSGLFPPTTGYGSGNPYQSSATRTSDRPIILNRPFYSVGELGYVSRDDPWRSLDFFSVNSADAGLLDLFTASDSDQAVVAGRLDLNTQNSAALTAVLNNTIADVVGGTSLSNPSGIAANMVKFTAPGATPLTGRDQIATKLTPSLSSTDFGTTDNQSIKARREGVARALADVGQTRTWNLMIDLVAQTGRYAPSATSLSPDSFVVQGERHYWLHVAIDRFTGQVIDQQLETVNE